MTIPLAIRVGKFPIKRDMYTPIEFEIPEIIEEEEKDITFDSIEGIWESINDWCERLSRSDIYITHPGQLEQRIIEISNYDTEKIDKFKQILEMIEWFHTSFYKSLNKSSDAFRKTLLFYFWDELLTLEEQKFLVYSTGLNVLECIQENQYMLGRILVNRFMNPKNGEIEFMCESGEPCVKAIIDNIKRDKNILSVNNKTTGRIYGFIVPKNGDVVFKTAEPPEESGKIGRGKECGNVSTMTGHITNLVEIGDILKANGKSDFDLNRGIIVGTRKIKNSTRACTLLDLLIRFLDADKIQGKRWFFRPVQAQYTGHKGVFRPGSK